MKKISVNEAVKKGGLWVNLPITFVIIGFMVLGLLVMHFSLIVGVILMIGAFPLGWLYWSYAIVKWKLWAYENVDDLVELKKAAVKAYLIWPDDSFFNKTEIKTTAEARKEDALLIQAGAKFVLTKTPLSDWRTYVYIIAIILVGAIVRAVFQH